MSTPNIHELIVRLDGVEIDSTHPKLVRGSDAINLYRFVAPFDVSLNVDIAFELQNGKYTSFLPLINDGETKDVTYEKPSEGEVTETFNVWYQNIPAPILSTVALIRNATRSNIAKYSVRLRETSPDYLGEFDEVGDLPTVASETTNFLNDDVTVSNGDFAYITNDMTTYEVIDDEWVDLERVKTIYANSRIISTKTLSISPSVIS